MKKSSPLVTLIITTKNEEENINKCFDSIKKQTYKKIELILVDNNSTDKTKEIAKKFTDKVYNAGPERSAQRNFGAKKSNGSYLLFLDADMKLTKNVVRDAVDKIGRTRTGGIIVPEESYGIGFWSEVKRLERSFYIGNDEIEAARFYSKKAFFEVDGFDESITGPEDWDLSQRIKEKYGLSRINSLIYHNEGKLTLYETISKKYYYSKKFSSYTRKSLNKKYSKKQINIIERYKIFLQNPKKLFKNPLLGFGVLLIKTLEFAAGSIGYIKGLQNK